MILKIYDDIVNEQEKEFRTLFGGAGGVTFGDIDEFVASLPDDDDTIDLLIHCRGGVVSEGWAIVDKLRSTGKKITATIDGMCASMAVSILLAASERRGQPHATLHIHKPYFPPYTLADSYNEDDLKRLAADLEMDTERMLDWYVERTGANREELAAIMAEDRDMPMEEAMRLGFVHSLVEPKSASVAPRSWKEKHTHTEDMAKTNEKAGIISAMANLLGIKVSIEEEQKVVNYVLMTEDGRELTIDKPEGEEIAVGDAASPDGEFVLEDGRTVVVEDGVITDIREPEPDDNSDEEDKEKANLKAEVERLNARVAELEGQAKNEDEKAILDKVAKAGGVAWLDEVAKSNYQPSRRVTKSGKADELSKTAKRLSELKEKKNN